jgi:hypothetical protein
MSRWFRWYAGTTEDGKFRMVARNAKVTVATVTGVWAALLEDASHPDHRGIVTKNEDYFAAVLDLGDGEAEKIFAAMQDADMISVGHGAITITHWKERQFETDTKDGTNADRQRRFRERRKEHAQQTDRNGTVTAEKRPDTEADTEKKEQETPLPPDGGRVSDEPNKHREALAAFEAYNDRALVLGLPQASKLTPDRKRRISARLRDFGPDGWAKALANLDTPFLRGLTDHRFRADLDFVCQAKSFSKLHDGGYAPAQGTPDAADRNRPARNLSKSERLKAAVDRAMHDNVTVFAARSSWKTADDGDAHAVFSGAEIIRA